MLTPFRIILSDCPWRYNDRKATRRDNPARKPKFGVGVERRYSNGTMGVQELCDMGRLVRGVAAPDAYLFQWVTGPLMPQGIRVMEAWGFRYVGIAFVWVKLYKRSGSLFRGPGRYVPSNVELCLLGVSGGLTKAECREVGFPYIPHDASRPWHPATGYKPQQVILEAHPRDTLTGKIKHSRKPEKVQDEIDRWLSPHLVELTPERVIEGELSSYFGVERRFGRLELFATRERPGWTCLGHALTGTDIRHDLAALKETQQAKEAA